MHLRTARLLRASLSLLLATATLSCGDDAKDPSTSVRVAALATEATTLDGPAGSSLVIPAGATDEDVTIVLTAPRTRRQGPADTTVVSGQFTLTPEGKTFLAPLELTIPITPSALPAGKTVDDVVVVRAPQGSDTTAFVPLPTRREGNAVVATTEHFSDFLAIVVNDPMTNPFGSCTDGMCTANESCSSCAADCGLCLPGNDSTPPTAVSLDSPQVTTGVRGDAVITVTFDEPILAASVTSESFAVVANGQGQPIAGSYATSGATVTFTPDPPLLPGRTYELKLGNGIRDLAGNVMIGAFSRTFTTAAGAALSIASPLNAAVGVSQNASILFVFSSAIDAQTIDSQQVDGPCSGSVQVSADGFASCFGLVPMVDTQQNSITLDGHATPFPGSAQVAVRFTGAARDLNGFGLGAAVGAYAFGVEADLVPPTLLSSMPSFDSGGVPLDAPIVLTFSEPIDPTSVTASNVTLTTDSQNVPRSWTVVGSVVTITPTAPLQAGAHYTMTIQNVRDLAQPTHNTILPGGGGSFDTIEPLHRTTSIPGDATVGAHPSMDLVLSFDDDVAAASLTMQATNGTCTGSVRVSDGNTCYGGTVSVAGTVVTIRANPLPNLANVAVSFLAPAASNKGAPFESSAGITFRVSPTNDFAYVISPGPATTQGGDLVSAGSLDFRCDVNMNGTRKAFVMTSTRRACATAWCDLATTPADSSLDWVLKPDTTYVDRTGALLFTTHPIVPIPPMNVDLANAFGAVDSPFYFFGGAWDWTVSSNCNDFTDGTLGFTGTRIDGAATTTAATGGWVVSGATSCNTNSPTLCADQVPVTEPAIH